MAIEKNINTRIRLKYDSCANWIAANPTLLSGEIAIAYLSDTNAVKPKENDTQHPVLFKVGPGAFNDLPWASALAADVYEWAKKNEVKIEGDGNAITAAAIKDGFLTFTKGETFATKTELEELRGDLEVDTNTTYEYEIPTDGDNAGKLVIYKKELGAERVEYQILDIITPLELTNALNTKLDANGWISDESGKLSLAKDVTASDDVPEEKNIFINIDGISIDHSAMVQGADHGDTTQISTAGISVVNKESSAWISLGGMYNNKSLDIHHYDGTQASYHSKGISFKGNELTFPEKEGAFALLTDTVDAAKKVEHSLNINNTKTFDGSADIVITAADLGLSGAMHFIGKVDILPEFAASGDVVLVDGKEYVWANSQWNELGDETSHALKSITITGTDGLVGGGNLETDRTIGLSDTTKASLAKADAALPANGWSTSNPMQLTYGVKDQTHAAVFSDEMAYGGNPDEHYEVTNEGVSFVKKYWSDGYSSTFVSKATTYGPNYISYNAIDTGASACTTHLKFPENANGTIALREDKISADQFKAINTYTGDDAEVWVFNCGSATELID